MYNKFIVTLQIILFNVCVHSRKSNSCESIQRCGECIQNLECIWCWIPLLGSSNETIHCINESRISSESYWCPLDKRTSHSKSIRVILNETFTSRTEGESVQINPQKVDISLRKGDEIALKFLYKQSVNYPVDLYYLMDISKSMKHHRDMVAKLGGRMVEVMKNFTKNVRIGFGSFMEKAELPFTQTHPSDLEKCNWRKENRLEDTCSSPYGFKNHVSLTDDFELFSEEVGKVEMSENFDEPECGFDAIMQVMVCEKEIGWRKKARRLLVFATDSNYHIAGDGKLVGVVEPNDAQCHLKNNEYTHSLILDYPSISQINYVAKQNRIFIIFVILPKKSGSVFKSYEKLQTLIENSLVGELAVNSSNVINIIADNYNRIAETVTISDNSKNSVEIKYSSSCPNPIENGCRNVRVGEVIEFTANIRSLQCLDDPQHIAIKPEGIDEHLHVKLNVCCKCDCENADHPEFKSNSSNCSGRGDLQCGICNCHSGYFGTKCECDSRTSKTDDELICKRNSNEEVCTSRGNCVCGVCICDKLSQSNRIYGKFCECDNFSCKRNNGLVCSGSSNGICECGQCKCLAGWTGDACECPVSNANCIALDGKGEICSGQGSCICGDCICNKKDEHRYSGRYCEECPSCPGQRCDKLRPCVECLLQEKEASLKLGCDCNNTVKIVRNISEDTINKDFKLCRAPDAVGCTILFQYKYTFDKTFFIQVQKKRVCPEKVNFIVIGGIVIGTIVLAGIVMLVIWKIITSIHDRREYEKFENERKQLKWNISGNPLYKNAVSVFNNPLYLYKDD